MSESQDMSVIKKQVFVNLGMIPLEIIEDHSRSYLSEVDIVRFEDAYAGS